MTDKDGNLLVEVPCDWCGGTGYEATVAWAKEKAVCHWCHGDGERLVLAPTQLANQEPSP